MKILHLMGLLTPRNYRRGKHLKRNRSKSGEGSVGTSEGLCDRFGCDALRVDEWGRNEEAGVEEISQP